MAKVTVECDAIIPEGWEIDRIGFPKKGEHYLMNDEPIMALSNFENSVMVILKRKKPTAAEVSEAINDAVEKLGMKVFDVYSFIHGDIYGVSIGKK